MRGPEVTKSIQQIFSEDQRTDGIISVYIFGSVARGDSHRDSDVDVGVLFDWGTFPCKRDRFDERLRLIALLEARLGREVDVVSLNDVPPTFGRAIFWDGTRILTRDEELDRAWTRDVQLRAPDLERWLDRMRRIKLEALTS